MTAQQDAGAAHRRVVGVERDVRRPGEELLDRDTRFEACEWRADAEVEAAAEREVGAVAFFLRARGSIRRGPVGSGPQHNTRLLAGMSASPRRASAGVHR